MQTIPIRRALTPPQARAMTTDTRLPLATRQAAFLALKEASGHPVNLIRLFPAPTITPTPRPARVTSPEGIRSVIAHLRAGFPLRDPFGGVV